MSMSGQSLGLIETVGLATAIEAADAAIKSANVELLGYESAKGNGMHTVKLIGDIGAVNAAVDAGVAAASRIGEVYAYKVLARTAEGLEAVITAGENVGTETKEAVPAQAELEAVKQEGPEAIVAEEVKALKEEAASEPVAADKVKTENEAVTAPSASEAEPAATKKVTKPATPAAVNKPTPTNSRAKSRGNRRSASN